MWWPRIHGSPPWLGPLLERRWRFLDAFTAGNCLGRGAQVVDRIVLSDVGSGRASTVAEVANPSRPVLPLAWLSEEVSLVSNLDGENHAVLYSIRIDETGIQRIPDLSGGHWLTISP